MVLLARCLLSAIGIKDNVSRKEVYSEFIRGTKGGKRRHTIIPN